MSASEKRIRTTRAGFPATIAEGGTSALTTEFAATPATCDAGRVEMRRLGHRRT